MTTPARDNPIWVDEWRAVLRSLSDTQLAKAAKDVQEDEGYFEEVLWEIARRSWESWAWGFRRPKESGRNE